VPVTVGCYCLLFEKKTVKYFAHSHAFAQSLPGRSPNDKYPVNTSHRSDLCKNVSLQYYLVTTVIHIQSVHCQIYMCVCVYVFVCVCIHTHTHTHTHTHRVFNLKVERILI